MKRMTLLVIAFSFAACMPSSAPTEAPRPTVNMVIEVASPTATNEPTFTPIPATFTTTPDTRRVVFPAGTVRGKGNETLKLEAEIPGRLKVDSEFVVRLFIISGEKRIGLDQVTPNNPIVSIPRGSPIDAIEIATSGTWQIEFLAPGSSAAATKSVATSAPASTKAPAPTRVILPTNPPIVVVPTNPPSGGTCCKYCDPAKSKPCGDSCISLDKTCHKGPGCACSK